MTHLALRLTVRSEARNEYIYSPFNDNVLELQGSSLYHVADEMIEDLYVLRPVVEHRILYHFYAALIVT